ncbi:hypothetical protein K1719_004006 [Acacia pycnantha]|nr:hypothetical protein K1719_004006 [Acacia pycnantha]
MTGPQGKRKNSQRTRTSWSIIGRRVEDSLASTVMSSRVPTVKGWNRGRASEAVRSGRGGTVGGVGRAWLLRFLFCSVFNTCSSSPLDAVHRCQPYVGVLRQKWLGGVA